MPVKLESFKRFSAPLQAAIVIAAGGGIVGAVAFLPSESKWIFLIGLSAVAIILVGYVAVLRWLKKRKAAPMEQDILHNTAASPLDVSEPARRARLDDLRKRFEEGVAKFRTAGKDLYGMPWYLVVGEPGSGKTEAIRHCNVGFPPGLQDRFQGAGGTINMNWWFTNHGVILDTAGRLMFEEVEAGRTGEWEEFLALLKRHRVDCPINGMLLVISAESLIADTAEALEKKGAKFAEQLDLVQRTLDVRFPVFIVVTKCDRIVGFKEFFENLEDPQSQHQMFGWSNPLALDEPFRPELLDQHLRSLLEHLKVRRLGLLLDPISTENPEARRTDQIDDLYAFPKHMTETILPRLRRYMEMIFVAGEWSAKPLFLRGIYFTSSMREGAALDAELAEALGVTLESLPEGRMFTKDRAYFLRDLFIDKIFREKGLVTRATNATAQHKRRRIALLAAGFVTVAALFCLTGYLAYSLHASIGKHRDYWRAAASSFDVGYKFRKPIVSQEYKGSANYRYGGMQELEVGSEVVPVGLFHKKLAEIADMPIKAPWIFSFARLASDITGPERPREQARCAAFEAGVLRPLLAAVRERMLKTSEAPDAWNADATGALTQLIRVESLAPYAPNKRFTLPKPADKAAAPAVPLDLPKLFKFALAGSPGDYEMCYPAEAKGGAESHGQALLDALNLECEAGVDGWNWPFEALDAGGEQARAAIQSGLTNYLRQVGETQWFSSEGIEGLKAAVVEYDGAEKALTQFRAALAEPRTIAEFDQFKSQWDGFFQKTKAAARSREEFAGKVGCDDPGNLAGWYKGAVKQKLEDIRREFGTFRAEALLPAGAAEGGEAEAGVGKAGTAKAGSAGEKAAEAGATAVKTPEGDSGAPKGVVVVLIDGELTKALSKMEKECEDPANKVALEKSDLQYRRFRMLSLADSLMQQRAGGADLSDELAKIRDGLTSAGEQIRKLQGGAAPETSAAVAQLAQYTSELGARKAAYDAFAGAIEAVAGVSADVPAHVSAMAKAAGEELSAPDAAVPFTGLTSFDPAYYPPAVKDLVAQVGALAKGVGIRRDKDTQAPQGGEIQPLDQGSLGELYRQQQMKFDAYFVAYSQYWAKKVPDERLAMAPLSWADYSSKLRDVQEWDVTSRLKKAVERIKRAMEVAGAAAAVTDEAVGKTLSTLAREALDKSDHTLKTLDNEDLKRQCQKFFTAWQQVDPDAKKAREELLLLEPADFQTKYLVVVFDKAPDYVIEYYHRLAVGMLEAVAGKFQADSKAAAKDMLNRYGKRFPLAPPAPGTPELTLAEFNECRAALSHMAPPAASGKKVFATGEKLGDREVDEAFAKLIAVRLEDVRQSMWLAKATELFKTIPEAGVNCQVWILTSQRNSELIEQAGLSDKAGDATWIWKRVSLVKGKTEGKKAQVGGDIAIGAVDCPGNEPIELLFWQFSDDPQLLRRLQIDSPWTCVWMLHQRHDAQAWEGKPQIRVGEARRSKDKPTNWDVRIDLLDDTGKLRVLWVELRFNRVLPEIGEWPSLGSS